MTNIETVTRLCNAICNTFYPDRATVEVMLDNENLLPSSNAFAKDATLLRIAIRLVMGYVEASHSEGGVSLSVRSDDIKSNIKFWCKEYGIEPDEVIEQPAKVTIDDITHLW